VARRQPGPSTNELTEVGLHQYRSGDVASARRTFEAVLARERGHLGALTVLSTIAMHERAYPLAVSLLERATKVAPQIGMLHSNLGEALRRLGRKSEALLPFRRAVERSPELTETHYNLGLTLEQLAQFEEACAAYERALQRKPDFAAAALGLLGALRACAEYSRAIAWYEQHAARFADTAALRCAVAAPLLDIFRIDEAVSHLERALELDPTFARAHADLAAALAERGEIDAALVRLRRAIELEPSNATYHGNLVYLSSFSARVSAAEVLAEARAFGARHAPMPDRPFEHPKDREPARRLRVGYVSADFRNHPAALFLRPLFRHHDRTRVHVIAYSNARRPDAITAELRSLVDEWRDISNLDDDSAAALIRADRVDVLVDLSQHSAGNRLLLFAQQASPVQISWLGYPGTTGVSAIDYRLTDSGLDPPELGSGHNSETLLWLPESFWCYAPLGDEPPVNDLPASKNGYTTFGCLNSFKKASDIALELWARVLSAVPDSRLLLVAPPGTARERVRRALAKHDVAEERVELVAPMPRAEYLATYQRIDIGLDPVPYGGGTTSLDAMWMGVPVVTLAGDRATSRAGSSLAQNLGLSEVVARSPEVYIDHAVALATDAQRLAELRQALRPRLAASSLVNAPRFAGHVEDAFFEAWQRSPRVSRPSSGP
jgi:protein O-GlcNAc transferase